MTCNTFSTYRRLLLHLYYTTVSLRYLCSSVYPHIYLAAFSHSSFIAFFPLHIELLKPRSLVIGYCMCCLLLSVLCLNFFIFSLATYRFLFFLDTPLILTEPTSNLCCRMYFLPAITFVFLKVLY